MVTGFDYLSKDKNLQAHWLRRFVAIVIDALIIYVPISIVFNFLGTSVLFLWIPPGIVFVLYAAVLDAMVGGTFGKLVMSLKSVSLSGKLDVAQTLMRNISKIFVLILLLDWIIGMAIDTSDPRQKWTDQLAGTSVILR